MNVKTILEEVQARLEPYRKSKVEAQDRQADEEVLKQQSTASLFKAKAFATDAHDRLAAHQETMRAQRAERIKARAKVIALGGVPEREIIAFDMEARRLQEEASEADAVLVQVQGAYDQRCDELAKAEAAVLDADAAISTAYIEGVATRMMELHSLIGDLHAELSKAAPDEIASRPGTYQRLPEEVRRALALVALDPLHTPANKLPGFSGTKTLFTHKTPQVNTGFQDEHPTRVLGPLPRNADGIPQII